MNRVRMCMCIHIQWNLSVVVNLGFGLNCTLSTLLGLRDLAVIEILLYNSVVCTLV